MIPLPQATVCGDFGRFKELLAQGADVNAADQDGYTPLYAAVSWGRTEAANALLDCGADVNGLSVHGYTPLDAAAENGDSEMVKLLLKKGANVHVSNPDGDTPLHAAAHSGNETTVELLLMQGPDVNAVANCNRRDFHHRTAEDLARKHGHAMVAETLRTASRQQGTVR